MCNIAGYIGEKQAAPILFEMLKKQEIYDGGRSTGICTIHEGKIYYKKVLGDTSEFIKNVDLSELPGTIGIAHSRPSRTYVSHAHPYISNNGRLAMVSNGTTPYDEELARRRDKITEELYQKGYTYVTQHQAESSSFPKLQCGDYVSAMDVVVNLAEEYMSKGKDAIEAATRALDDMYSERVGCIINADEPDYIGVIRLTRPMEILTNNGESYIATTRFGFPEDVEGDVYSIPVLRACKVTKTGFELLPYKIETDGVAEILPNTYRIAYDKIEAMLKEKPCVWDEIEIAMLETPELWDEKHRYSQYAKVGYDILWQIHKEGRLKSFMAPQVRPTDTRILRNMFIED